MPDISNYTFTKISIWSIQLQTNTVLKSGIICEWISSLSFIYRRTCFDSL